MASGIASGVALAGLNVIHLSRRRWNWQLLVSSVITNGVMPFYSPSGILLQAVCLLGLTFSDSCAKAQITPDTTLGAESSVITPQAPNSSVDVIQGGATIGTNLFHSFEQFSVPNGGTAYFNNALNIQNIFSRVTGSSISNIDGLIQSNGTANLFLLNPNGIIFGRNASLNIGGSFLGSTATSINFTDGRQFSATGNPTTQLLTVSVPIGLQFGGTAGSILNQSRTTNSSGQSVGLQVLPGKTLSLVGGDVRLDGGRLEALGGRVELGGVAGAGTVGLVVDSNNLLVSFPDGVARADVYLTNSGSNTARVNVASSNGGNIAITARNIDIVGESLLRGGLETNLGFLGAQAGNIELRATEASNLTYGIIANNVRSGAVGNGGNIIITAGSIFMTNGALLQAVTAGQGNAGNINITAGSLSVTNGAQLEARTAGQGNAGNINITAGSLSVTNGAQLEARTAGQGNAGIVTINTRDTVSFDGGDAFSNVESGAVGAGGGINITAGSLVTNSALLASTTYGQGNAGNITITARDTVSMGGGVGNKPSSGIYSIVGDQGVGNGGDINITSGSLSVRNGNQVSASTIGHGDAGSVTINARDTVSFEGVGTNGRTSGVFSAVAPEAVGNGNVIVITAESLSVTNGAQVTIRTGGQGNAGSVTINARDTVSFEGVGSNGSRSGAFSTVDSGAIGNGGSINIITDLLSLTNSAGLFASSEGSGAAGIIEVAADSIRLENLAFLSADTIAGQGNIFLRSQELVLSRNSNITTNATGTASGGNITIDTDILVASENSDISANAGEAFGGRVRIDAQGIFGTEFRLEPTEESDITASSRLGPQFSGIVEINIPDVDPSQGLVNLPAELVDASGLIAQTCSTNEGQGQSEFIVTGRGGLPPNPNEALSSEPVQVDWVTLNPRVENRSSSVQVTQPTASFVEAQGWVTNAKGEVVLITSHTDTLHSFWQTPTSCRMPKSSLGQ